MHVMEVAPEFGLDRLRSAERPDPEPGPGDVLLRMTAASINYRDKMMVEGSYNPRQPLPLIPCSDGCGVVEAVGEGVTRFSVGDRAVPLFAPYWHGGEPTPARVRRTLGGPLDGTLAERLVLPEDAFVKPPEHLSDVEAATLGCAGLTAWSALTIHGGVRAGDTVLVLGTGGVSIFAVQFGVALGARVIVTSSSDEKLARAAELGADAGIHYGRTPRWSKAVRELTAGRGADLVVEIGGGGTLQESIAATRMGGRVALIGVLAGVAAPLNLIPALMNQLRLQGVLVGHRDGFEAMNRAIETHKIRPVVDRTHCWTEAAGALASLERGEHFGKIGLSFETTS